ncbi:MAG: protein-L-isoaspartate(D-aspartate) O-methyltransferase [Thermogutta sp.]
MRTRWVIAGTLLLIAGCVGVFIFLVSTPGLRLMSSKNPPRSTEAFAVEKSAFGGNGSSSVSKDDPVNPAEQSEEKIVSGPCRPVFLEEPEAFRLARQRMVQFQLQNRDIIDADVLYVMGRIPRHEFVPENVIHEAYDDHPLPIGHGQTISQPYIVALMTQLAKPRKESRALDIGTGSGYQAAVLAELCREVYSIEIIEPLAKSAAERLKRLGYTNVVVRAGDGYRGWPEKAPFDVIIVAAAPDHVPKPLVDQLALGGRLVIPVGRGQQDLLVIEKQPDGSIRQTSVAPVLFVPMTGEAHQLGKSSSNP